MTKKQLRALAAELAAKSERAAKRGGQFYGTHGRRAARALAQPQLRTSSEDPPRTAAL